MHSNAVLVLALAAAAGQAAAYPALGPNARRAAFDAFGPAGAPSAPSASGTPAVPVPPNAAAVAPPSTSSAVATTSTTGTGTGPLTNANTNVLANTGTPGAPAAPAPGGLNLDAIMDAIEQAIGDLDGAAPGTPGTPGTAAQQQQKRDAAKDHRRQQIKAQLGAHPKRDAAAPEDSEALNLGGLFKAGTSIVSGIASLFGGGDSSDQNQRRELLELLARDAATPDDESGALGIDTIFKVGSALFHGAESLFGGSSQQQRREVLEVLARGVDSGALDLHALLQSKIPIEHGPIMQQARASDLSYLNGKIYQNQAIPRPLGPQDFLGRNQARDESGALDLASLQKEINDHQAVQRPQDLFGSLQAQRRDAPADSEALNLGGLFKAGTSIVSGIASLFGGGDSSDQNQRRELLELLARDATAAPGDESGALGIDTIFKVGSALFHGAESLFGGSSQQQRREVFEILARSGESGAVDIQKLIQQIRANAPPPSLTHAGFTSRDATAQDGDDSGALGLSTIVNVGTDIFKGVESLFGGSSNQQQRRELLELLARDAAAQDGDDSGALGLSTIVNVGSDIFKGVESIFGGGSDNQQQKRELLELLARDAAAAQGTDESGALGIDTLFKVGSALFHGAESLFGGSSSSGQSSKRAPEPFVIPPGSSFHPAPINDFPNGFHPLMLATAAPAQARSLNDLD
ncbi:hypothetical protein PsYK624_035110 [Phanerochaete sordida]|uniref:Uncharacterized protein n=1 Tax=Phanerochaete sordida TaxID=48140 RepID=A0A9P3G371_9APHY|nr:hypothetical protein PsYK624_035110 [Phanerochaete sordida]